MSDNSKIQWGLHPIKTENCLSIWGARAVFENGRLDLLPDRQTFHGHSGSNILLQTWLNSDALPRLREYIKKKAWNGATTEIYSDETSLCFSLKASPCASYGYIYLTAQLKGRYTFPEGKWSGKFIPEVGETIIANVNGIGQCTVIGFFLKEGWCGVIAKPLNPPDWFKTQKGKGALCTFYGTEISKKNGEEQCN